MLEMAPHFDGKEAFVVYAALVIMLGRACGYSSDPQRAAIRAVEALGGMVGVPVITDGEEESDDERAGQSLN